MAAASPSALLPAIPGLSGNLLSSPIVKGALVVLLIVIILYFLFKAVKKLVHMLLNSFLGLVLLVGLNFFPALKVPITIFSVLLVLFGGLMGLIVLVILKLLGITL